MNSVAVGLRQVTQDVLDSLDILLQALPAGRINGNPYSEMVLSKWTLLYV